MTANSGLNSGRKSENGGNTGAKARFIEEKPRPRPRLLRDFKRPHNPPERPALT